MKSRSLIPASESGPVLPLFDAPEPKASRPPGNSGGGSRERARPESRGKSAGAERSGRGTGKASGKGSTQESRSKGKVAGSQRRGKAETGKSGRKAARAAQSRLAFSEEEPEPESVRGPAREPSRRSTGRSEEAAAGVEPAEREGAIEPMDGASE